MQVSFLYILVVLELQTAVTCAPVFESWLSKGAVEVAQKESWLSKGAVEVAQKASQSIGRSSSAVAAAVKPAEFLIPAQESKFGLETVRFRGTGVQPAVVADPPAPVVHAGRFKEQVIVNPVDGEVLGKETVPVWRPMVKEKHI